MAIFGIGANYGGDDVVQDFLSNGVACVGYKEEEAPPAHAILKHLRTGDIIFIKSFNPQVGLTIKAVGIVLAAKLTKIENPDIGMGVPVKWVWNGEKRLGKIDDKWPVRSVTIYEEYNPRIQKEVIDLLLDSIMPS